MTRRGRRVIATWLASLLILPLVLSVEGAAQEPAVEPAPAAPEGAGPAARRMARRGAANPEVMTVQQVEDYFDQVVLHQARTNLSLTDDQFLRFGAGLRRLQVARRQLQRRRLAMVRDLNSLINATPFDESEVTAKLKALDDISAQSVDEIRTAYDAIDHALTLRQRARFRIFEEMMERRKLDLVSRARQQASRSNEPAR